MYFTTTTIVILNTGIDSSRAGLRCLPFTLHILTLSITAQKNYTYLLDSLPDSALLSMEKKLCHKTLKCDANETVQMRGHNIWFQYEIRKYIIKYSLFISRALNYSICRTVMILNRFRCPISRIVMASNKVIKHFFFYKQYNVKYQRSVLNCSHYLSLV